MAARMLLFAFALFSVTSFSFQSQARYGFLPTHFPGDYVRVFPTDNPPPTPFPKPAKVQLLYYGGPVIGNVKVYAIFWGPNVNSEVAGGIGGFFGAVTNSTYMDWLDEYNTFVKAVDGRQGTDQHIGRGSYAGAITITPSITSKTITDDDIQTELQKQIDAGVIPKADDNTLYMTYFPPGISISAFGAGSCVNFCAYHGFKGDPATAHFYYGVMPDIGGACSTGCGFAMGLFDSMTVISSHEYMEAITDPFPTPGDKPAYPQAWNTNDGNEIGDLCARSGNNPLVSSARTYTVQSEFDNASAKCTTKSWSSP